MADDTRTCTGPLSERQRYILMRLAEGHLHAQIGKELGVSREYIGRIIHGGILPKLGVSRPTEAIAKYARAQGLREASVRMSSAVIPHPIDATEEHTNHVLEGLAAGLRRMANDLMP